MQEKTTKQIEVVCNELAKILAELMQYQAPKGQQIIIHVSRDRQNVWIEKPPEIVHIRP